MCLETHRAAQLIKSESAIVAAGIATFAIGVLNHMQRQVSATQTVGGGVAQFKAAEWRTVTEGGRI